MDDVIEIRDKLSKINVKDRYRNKYFYLATTGEDYRYLSQGDLLKSYKIPKYVREFIREHKEALFIPNSRNDLANLAVIRAINDKKFIVMGRSIVPYGYWDLDVKYGEVIVVVEGVADCDSMRRIYKNSVS